ncbi:MAG: prevent-host-death protein [Leptospira sp.]|nr:prevent-host-death protein [Leptospira sp.]
MKNAPQKINLGEAKAHLGKYAKLAKKGKEFLICERNEPIARLHGINDNAKSIRPIQLGLAMGQIQFLSEWSESNSEIEELFSE